MAHALAAFSIAKEAITSMADFQESISKLGAKTQYSATQVAEGMNYLAMAGFKTNDILKTTADVLNLATVGQMDLGRTSDIASNILSGFGLKADELKRVVDVSFNTPIVSVKYG